MNRMQRTIIETVALLAIGTTVAYAGNAFRKSHSIEWTRDYFKKVQVQVPIKASPLDEAATANVATTAVVAADSPSAISIPAAAEPEVEKHLQHDYQSIDLAGVEAAIADPRYEQGMIVIVDARADEPFEAGRIPGAVQCDHYQLDKFIGPVIAKARVADQVIVYCNGGQCEDSIFMCQNLMEHGLAYDAIFLYEGGWKEWEKSGNPIATGKE